MTQRNPPDDSELQAIYRAAAQDAGDEPDAQIDARILAAARAASGERRARRQRPPAAWWKGWLVPVSVTAVAVLGVSLSFRVNEEQVALEAARQMGEAPPASRNETAPPLAPERESTATGAPERADRRAEKPNAQAVGRSPAASVDALPEAAMARPAPAAVAAKKESLQEPIPASPPALRAKAVDAPPPAAPAPAPAPAPTLDDRASQAAKAAVELRESSARRSHSIESDRALGADAAASGVSSQSLPPARQNEETAALEASPERWLEKIRDLRRANRLAEAQKELDRFRQRYPDFALPADLK